MGALSIDQVLAEEAEVLRAPDMRAALAAVDADVSKRARAARARVSADRRDGTKPGVDDVEQRKAFYRSLNRLNRAALCCSGGGIRSATFCLGVIQGLARHVVSPPADAATAKLSPRPQTDASNQPVDNGAGAAVTDTELSVLTPQNSLLGRFSYLSTVSGGGYIGSWLSSWRAREDFETILCDLTGRPSGSDIEPPELSWLRAYSNYLTPRVGLASADAWTGATLFTRNLILNWFVILPVVCLALLGLKFIASLAVWIARSEDNFLLVIAIGLLGVALLIVAQAFTTRHRPTRRQKPGTPLIARDGNVTQKGFLLRDFPFAIVSAVAVTSFFCSRWGFSWASSTGKTWVVATTALAGLVLYAAGWIVGWPLRLSHRDFMRWTGSGLIYGGIVGFGAYLFTLLKPYDAFGTLSPERQLLTLLIPMIFGVPWVLSAQLTADMIFAGLTSYERDSDSDREWLGRAAAWLAVGAIVWAVVAFLVFAGGYYIESVPGWISKAAMASTGGVAGIATAILGTSAKTPARATDADVDWTGTIYSIVLTIVGPLFAAILIIFLSVALDRLLFGASLINILQMKSQSTGYVLLWLLFGLVITAAIALLGSLNINVNRFSLHAIYRNRLIRAYLGASRRMRDPDQLTGFDIEDNLPVHELWPPKQRSKASSRCLFHVLNIALNVVSTSRLAWQERKAELFTVSPLHCGSGYRGFRRSDEYGDRPGEGGITLGTAMAISGAAVSPNMGYNSSPSITLLLTLFNVRLGWWLGNPGDAGEKTYQSDGPRFAAAPLFGEALGLTTDDRPYVYLSDGGHFENLGLYEMVRRRCRFIVVIDAGCDPKFAFEDLGNAARKIYIDLGIRIEFDTLAPLDALRNRPTDGITTDAGQGQGIGQGVKIPYHAIGIIDYPSADDSADGEHTCEPGYVLYIKPAYHGTEGAGIRSYATAHNEFPHETTLDQWFTELQFESYRSLGLDIVDDILKLENEIKLGRTPAASPTLREVLTQLHALEGP